MEGREEVVEEEGGGGGGGGGDGRRREEEERYTRWELLFHYLMKNDFPAEISVAFKITINTTKDDLESLNKEAGVNYSSTVVSSEVTIGGSREYPRLGSCPKGGGAWTGKQQVSQRSD